MIPPQVNGATRMQAVQGNETSITQGEFPMIPPQVNGAT